MLEADFCYGRGLLWFLNAVDYKEIASSRQKTAGLAMTKCLYYWTIAPFLRLNVSLLFETG